MDKNDGKKKEFFLWRWLKRGFFGSSRELLILDEKYESPGRIAVKRFFSKSLAVGAIIVFGCLFLFVSIGPLFKPVDLAYMEPLHANLSPSRKMMAIPQVMKENGTKSISSRGSFTLGLDKSGKLHTWGYYGYSGKNKQLDVMHIPEEARSEKILFAAAGSDHCVAIGESGKIYAWGAYDNGQYGREGTFLASCMKEPDEFIDGFIDVSQVKDLICGVQVTAILMKDGTVYAWGNDQSGADNISSILRMIREEGLRLDKIVFTNTGMFGISKEGKFVSGSSAKYENYEQIMPDGTHKTVNLTDYIGRRRIADIAASGDSLALVMDGGEIFSPGVATDIPVIPEGEKVITVSAGMRHFGLLTSGGRVYAWGSSKLGQTDVPKKLQKKGAVDQLISTGFQNYAFRNGKLVGTFGLKGYLMGTDDMGRDVFNRVMNGGRMTMLIGAVSVIVATVIGIIVGCISGYFGGKVDILLMRVTEVFGAIPFLPFALVLSAILQASNLKENTRIFIIMLILGVLSWTGLARLIRGQVLSEREKEFVMAARAMGIKEKNIAFRHILPNVVSVILVTVTLDFATCMLIESDLSYLGFGVQLPRPTWGNMLYGCKNALVIENYWWRWLFPALFLSVAVICINIVGDTLRDVLDPKSEVEK